MQITAILAHCIIECGASTTQLFYLDVPPITRRDRSYGDDYDCLEYYGQ